MLHGGGRGNQWTVAVVGRQHVVEQYAEEARLIFVLLDDALVQLAVEVDVVQQRITASDAFVGVAPAKLAMMPPEVAVCAPLAIVVQESSLLKL